MSEKDVVENVDSLGEISIPIATNSEPGIASFDSNDFTVGADGKVNSIVGRGIPQYLGKITGTGTGTTDLNWEVDWKSRPTIDAGTANEEVDKAKRIKIGEYIMLTEHFNQFVPGDIFRITNVQIEGSAYTVKTNNVRALSLASIIGPQGKQGEQGEQGVSYLAYTNNIVDTVDPVISTPMYLTDGAFNRTPAKSDAVTVDWYNSTTHRAFMVTGIISDRASAGRWVALITAITDITGAVGPQGKEGAGIGDIVDIDYPHGEFTSVQYDTDDGIKLQGIAQYLRDDGETYQIPTDIDIPLKAGNGINIDVSEDGKHVEVKNDLNIENGMGEGSLQQKTIAYNKLVLDFVPSTKTYVETTLGYTGPPQSNAEARAILSAIGCTSDQITALFSAVGYKGSVYCAILIASKDYSQTEAIAATNAASPDYTSISLATDLIKGVLKEYGITADSDLSNIANISQAIAMGIHSIVYSPVSVVFGLNNIIGDSSAPVDGIGSFSAGINNKSNGMATFTFGRGNINNSMMALVVGDNLKNYKRESAVFGVGTDNYTVNPDDGSAYKRDQRYFLDLLAEAGAEVTGTGDDRMAVAGVNYGAYSILSGVYHWNGGSHSVIFGNQNVIGEHDKDVAVDGEKRCMENTILNGLMNFIDKSTRCTAVGYKNRIINSNDVTLIGSYLEATNSKDKVVIGTYNENNVNAFFEVGMGNANDNRYNAFEVLKDGRAKVHSAPTEDDDVVRLTELKAACGEKVSLTFPAGATNGTLTGEQLATLQASEANYIEMVNDKELYYLNDNGHVDGYLTYSHVGIENNKATIKTLTITVSAKSFVIVTTVVPTESGGGKLYQHWIKITLAGTPTFIVYLSINDNYGTEYTVTTFASKYKQGDNYAGFPAVCNRIAEGYTYQDAAGVVSAYVSPYDISLFGVINDIANAEPLPVHKPIYTIEAFVDTVTEL